VVKLFAGYEYIKYAPPRNAFAAGTGLNDIAGDLVCAGRAAINNANIIAAPQPPSLRLRQRITERLTPFLSWSIGSFAKNFDAYAGIMLSRVNGGLANGYLHRNTADPTVGLRFLF
jgi:hypothetical protein